MVGWNVHSDNCNVFTVPVAGMTAFVPTYGEEHFDEQLREKLNPNGPVFQSYVLHPSATLVEGLTSFSKGKMGGTGGDPTGSKWANRTFYLQITSKPDPFSDEGSMTRKTKEMTVAEAAIYSNAKGARGQLAKNRFLSADSTKITLWPGPLPRPLQMPATNGNIKVEMVDSQTNAVISEIHGVYDFHRRAGGLLQVFKRGFKSLLPFQTDYKLKNAAGNPASLEMLRGADDLGNSAQLTFEVTRDADGVSAKSVTLVDVEFSLWIHTEPIAASRVAASSTGFRIDADDLDSVSGLVCAMEYEKMYGEGLETIQAHQRALEAATRSGTTYETPVNAYACVELAAQELIARTYSSRKRYGHKLRGDSKMAIKEAIDLFVAMRDLRESPQKKSTNARKKLIFKSKANLLSAISKRVSLAKLDPHEKAGFEFARDVLNGIDTYEEFVVIFNRINDTVLKEELLAMPEIVSALRMKSQ
jgi:hypothetical protein